MITRPPRAASLLGGLASGLCALVGRYTALPGSQPALLSRHFALARGRLALVLGAQTAGHPRVMLGFPLVGERQPTMFGRLLLGAVVLVVVRCTVVVVVCVLAGAAKQAAVTNRLAQAPTVAIRLESVIIYSLSYSVLMSGFSHLGT